MEFHPYGEFFASGSVDTNLKIWDIRQRSCIQTYRGHSRAVRQILFSPDGRWIAPLARAGQLIICRFPGQPELTEEGSHCLRRVWPQGPAEVQLAEAVDGMAAEPWRQQRCVYRLVEATHGPGLSCRLVRRSTRYPTTLYKPRSVVFIVSGNKQINMYSGKRYR